MPRIHAKNPPPHTHTHALIAQKCHAFLPRIPHTRTHTQKSHSFAHSSQESHTNHTISIKKKLTFRSYFKQNNSHSVPISKKNHIPFPFQKKKKTLTFRSHFRPKTPTNSVLSRTRSWNFWEKETATVGSRRGTTRER